MGPYKIMAEMAKKDKLREQIYFRLQNIQPEKSLLATVIHTTIKNKWNFENLIDMLKGEIDENKSGVAKVIGHNTVDLIIKYLKK